MTDMWRRENVGEEFWCVIMPLAYPLGQLRNCSGGPKTSVFRKDRELACCALFDVGASAVDITGDNAGTHHGGQSARSENDATNSFSQKFHPKRGSCHLEGQLRCVFTRLCSLLRWENEHQEAWWR